MKTTKLVLSAFAAVTMAFGGVAFVAAPQAMACGGSKTMAKLTTVEVPVEGMTCGSCADKIASALEAVDGITAVSVNVEAKVAKVTYDAEKVTVDQIVAEIDKAGFRASAPKRA